MLWVLKAIALVLVGGVGIGFSVVHLRRNWKDYRSKAKGSVKLWDLAFNYGLSFLWFAYLLVFFGGIIVNNLIIK